MIEDDHNVSRNIYSAEDLSDGWFSRVTGRPQESQDHPVASPVQILQILSLSLL